MNSKLLRSLFFFFKKPALMRVSEEIPVQLLAALPFGLEVSSFPDLLWKVAVLLPQLLDHGASERSSPLTLRLSLLSVRVRHVSIFRNEFQKQVSCCGNLVSCYTSASGKLNQ